MTSVDVLNLMNLLQSIQKTQEKILEELRRINSPTLAVKDLEGPGDTWDRDKG